MKVEFFLLIIKINILFYDLKFQIWEFKEISILILDAFSSIIMRNVSWIWLLNLITYSLGRCPMKRFISTGVNLGCSGYALRDTYISPSAIIRTLSLENWFRPVNYVLDGWS